MGTSTPSRTRTHPGPLHPIPVLRTPAPFGAPRSWLIPCRLWTLFPLCQGSFCPLPRNVVPFPEHQAGNKTQVSLSCSTATHSTFGRTAHKNQPNALPDVFNDFLLPSSSTGQEGGRREAGGRQISHVLKERAISAQLFLTFNASSQVGFDTPVMSSYPPQV